MGLDTYLLLSNSKSTIRVSAHSCTSGLWLRVTRISLVLPVLHSSSCRYPGPVGRVGGRDELLRHEDRPQQRHLPAVAEAEQPAGHRVGQVRGRDHTITQPVNTCALRLLSHGLHPQKQKQTLPICRRLKYYANAAKAEPGLAGPSRLRPPLGASGNSNCGTKRRGAAKLRSTNNVCKERRRRSASSVLSYSLAVRRWLFIYFFFFFWVFSGLGYRC